MSTDPEIGGPLLQDRELVYAHMRLSDREVGDVERMIHESGQRQVARAALTNVRVRFNSLKNGCSRVVESHTCELVHAYELELDPDVQGYYVQVPCRRIRRTTTHGRAHISTAHLDFLVFRRNRIELVECKQREWVEKQCQCDADWQRVNGTWTCTPYANWAAQHRLGFRIWIAPEPPGTYLQNLEACYGMRDQVLNRTEQAAVTRALMLIHKRPMAIEELISVVSAFNERLALWMLAHGEAFGPWKSTSLALVDRFHLYADQAQAKVIDARNLKEIAENISQPAVTDPLLLASKTDISKARERLARLALIERGELPPTRRMRALAHRVRKNVRNGRSALSACLTEYAHCGNRESRLLPEQRQAIEKVIARYWHTGRARRPKDLQYVLEQECERLGVPPCSRAVLDERRRRESPLRHALATGGFRAYHALRPSTDPRARSVAPLGYGQVLHVDSSDLDVRCAPDLLRCLPAAKAKFYIGLDGATGDTMAHALIFGPARTEGLALLLREYVKRNRMLPRMIHVDRGPENTSHWIQGFCEGRISLRHSPTAASAWNGIAENAIKQVNDQVAHRLVGSTAPDQLGRKVDGRFKSRRNARTSFVTVLEHFMTFIYEDLPRSPKADGLAPMDKKAEAITAYGEMGIPCEWDDDLKIQTSIQIARRKRSHAQRGIRTQEGWFSSDALIAALRTQTPDEIRSDCCDPSILYVRIKGAWIKAFHNRVLTLSLCTEQEKLFELLWAPLVRTEARARREKIARSRNSRLQLAEFARPATQHLSSAGMNVEPPASNADTPDMPPDNMRPFEEREDFE